MPKKCWLCGADATAHYEMFKPNPEREHFLEEDSYLRDRDFMYKECHQREYCESCFNKVGSERKAQLKEYVRLKNILMVERAVRSFERQNADIYEYKEAIESVQEYFSEHPEKFDSSQEVLAAIVLIYNHIETKVQYRVGKYRVDFFLPKLMTCLEIDGERHRTKKTYDSNRDTEIKQILGEGYDVVRIPTKYIDQNAKQLVEAIKLMRIERITGKMQPIKSSVIKHI